MFKLNAFKQHPNTFADLIPWAALVAPGVILNKDGSLQRTCIFRGPDLCTASDEQMQAAMARLNNVFRRLGSGWAVYVESRREPLSCTMSPVPQDQISLLIDLEHHKRFEDNEYNFQTNFYLTLQYLPESTLQQSLWKNFIKSAGELQTVTTTTLLQFTERTEAIYNLLKDLCYEAAFLSDEQTLKYLHDAVSTKTHSLKVPETPIYLDALLADTPLLAGLEPQLGNEYLKSLTIIGFPAQSFPSMLDRLNQLPFSFRWMTRFLPMDKLAAEKQLKKHRQRWFAKRKNIINMLQEVFTKQESQLQDKGAIDKTLEIDEALQFLSSDSISYGYMTCTITVRHSSSTVANEHLQEIEKSINGLGFTTINETINALEAWLATLAGHAYANVRKPLLHSLNLSHLIPFSSTWRGQDVDPHLQGAPLFLSYTNGNTPFRYSLHIGDVGHTMIIGPTGAGKSVLLNFMALQFRRYPRARVIIFDKAKSFFASTRAVQGEFYELAEEDSLHFQPLATIDRDEEKRWAAEWLQQLFVHEKINFTADMQNIVWAALTSLAQLPQTQRTLSGLMAFLQHQELRRSLQRFTVDGPFGLLLDAQSDNLANADWLCFEMEALMAMPSVITPVLNYLFHRLENDFQGEPTLMILDEAWLFLDNPLFAEKIKEWLKSLRKKNVSVIFATQSIADSTQHKIAATLLESCPGRIFLPNDRALEHQIKIQYESLGLNEQQILILANAVPKHDYYYQSQLGNRLFSLELGELALAFCAASNPTDQQFLQQTRHLTYTHWLSKFLHYKDITWAIDILQSQELSAS